MKLLAFSSWSSSATAEHALANLASGLPRVHPSDDHVRQGWRLCHDGRPAEALTTASTHRQVALSAGDANLAAALSEQIAWFCLQTGDVDAGLDHAREAALHFASAGDLAHEARCRAVLAWLMLECGIVEEAAEGAVAALSLAEQCREPATLSFAANVLGVVFWSCKQLDRALPLCERAVAIARGCDDPVALGWWVINLAGVHAELAYLAKSSGDGAGFRREIAIALAINDEAVHLLRTEGWGLRIALCNAAEYLLSIGDSPAAERSLDEWTAVAGGATTRTIAQYFFTKAQLLVEQQRFEQAIEVGRMSLDLAVESRNTDSEAHALRYMSLAYEGQRQFEPALQHFKRYHEAQLRMSAERTQRRARFAEILYETERFKRLADEAARVAAAANQRAEELERSALIDPLTRLGNRRCLELLFSELRQQPTRFHVAVVDLDHFKSINDRFTHMVGDEVLRRVSASIVEGLPAGGAAVRQGGEEFAIIVRDRGADEAARLCRDLAEQIAAVPWAEIRAGLVVTASIGIAAAEEADGYPERVLALADQRVYAAKASGRDCVVGATIELRRGGPSFPDGARARERSAAA